MHSPALPTWALSKSTKVIGIALLLLFLFLSLPLLRSMIYRNLAARSLGLALTLKQPALMAQAESYADQAVIANQQTAGGLAYHLGIAYQQMGMEEAAIAHFEKARQAGGLSASALGDLLLRLAEHYNAVGDKQRAADNFQQILAMDTNELPLETVAHANVYLGQILGQESGDLLLERQYLERALNVLVDSLTMGSYLDLATAMREEHSEEALEMATLAIGIQPWSPWPPLVRCGIHLKRQELAEAATWCQRARDLDPKNHHAHVWLGITYERQGLLPQALAEYELAAALTSDNSWYLNLIQKVQKEMAEE